MNHKGNSGENINFLNFSSSARPVYTGSTSSPTCSFEALKQNKKVVVTKIRRVTINPEEKAPRVSPVKP